MTKFFLRIQMFGFLLLSLAACSGLNLGVVGMLQNLDIFRDDIANMTFAIDAPLTLLPRDEGVVFLIDATTAQYGERHIHAVLVRGDDFEAVAHLPPPANNRIYHLFAFSEADKEKVREFQKWALDLNETYGDAGGELTMDIKPSFCRVSNNDVSAERVSVYISLPDEPELSPLLSNVKLSDIGDNEANNLPVCVQT